jgi:hypothetical protein
VLSRWTGGELIRLQCYEGIDAAQAVYDWDYGRQLLHLRAARPPASRRVRTTDSLESELYQERFLVKRALLRGDRAARGTASRCSSSDEVGPLRRRVRGVPARGAVGLAITVPELGTFSADTPPIVVLTSNRTRDVPRPPSSGAACSHWGRAPRLRPRGRHVRPARPRGRRVAGPPGVGPRSPRCAPCRCTSRRASPRPSTGRPRGGRLGCTELDEQAVLATLGAVLKVREDHEARRAARHRRRRRAGPGPHGGLTPWPTRAAVGVHPGGDGRRVRAGAARRRVGRARQQRGVVHGGPGRRRDRRSVRRVLVGAGDPRAPSGGPRAVRPRLPRVLGARDGRRRRARAGAVDHHRRGRRRHRGRRRRPGRRAAEGVPVGRAALQHHRGAARARTSRLRRHRARRGPPPDDAHAPHRLAAAFAADAADVAADVATRRAAHGAGRTAHRGRADRPLLPPAGDAPPAARAAARRERLDGALRPGPAAVRAGRRRRTAGGSRRSRSARG